MGVLPISDIFGLKGAIPLALEHKDEIKQKVIEKASSHFSLSEWMGLKDKIREIADSLHQQALLTPDKNDDSIDFMQYLYDQINRAPITHFAPEWFKDIAIYLTALVNTSVHDAVQWTFKMVYQFVSGVVLWTPDWLFEGSWFSDATFKFTIVNISLVTIMTMIQGLKRILRMKHTPLKDIIKRFPIALTVSAATPILFSQGIKWLNKVTKFILNLSGGEISSNNVTGIFSTSIMFDFANIFLMLIFLVLIILKFIPLFTFHGRRWFNIIVQGILCPFAMTAYVFDETRHYFDSWFSTIKDTCKKQLIYAVFVALLGIVMFATPNPTTFTGTITKSILMLGGIDVLANPPSVFGLSGMIDRGNGMIGTIKDLNARRIKTWNQAKNIKIKTEDAAVKTAGIAGKIWRIFNKK